VSFVLDTDTVSYALRGEGGVADRLRAVSPTEVALPAPVLFEIRSGVLRLQRGARRQALMHAVDTVVGSIRVLAFDRAAAEAAALARAKLEAAGAMIGTIDLQIAGIALANGATLVTRNRREFVRVEGLKVESWYAVP
jgi:tRNA(fMet)-specific endonuclease VapC